MTRLERIWHYLRENGPATTRQIAEAFGWKYGTATAVVSHARSYGYVEVARTEHTRPRGEGSPVYFWNARAVLIRKPGHKAYQ